MTQKKRIFPLLLVFSLFFIWACGFSLTKEQPAPQAPAPAAVNTSPAAQPSGPQGSLGGNSGGAQPSNAQSHPARSFQEAESAVVKIIATGTEASLEEGQTVYNEKWVGSGFIIDPSGFVVTNNHVAGGAATLKVYIGGDIQKEFPARVVAASECMDLAVLKIDGGPFPVYLDWFNGTPQVGMQVYAAGYPAVGDHWQYTLTNGIISKVKEVGDSDWASMDYTISHTAKIHGGNSGGPLISSDGRVVGVNYASAESLDINLAIPGELARPVVEQLRQGKPYRWIGVNGKAITITANDGSTIGGIWVTSVESGSPADRVGLKGGDIIVTVENINISRDGTMRDYCEVLSSHTPKDPLKIEVVRLSTGEILEGTLNTDETLKPEGQLAGGSGGADTGNAGSGGAAADGFVTITDDLKAIVVDVPATWSDVNGSPWNTTWTKADGSQYDVRAASLAAAPSLTAFDNFEGPGVWLIASRDFGRIGGYAQLLEGVQHWFNQDCELYEQGNYTDPIYEGQYQVWDRCGPQGQIISLVAAVRPKANPTAYLTLVVVSVSANEDAQTVVGQILNTFQVVGQLP